MKTVTHPPNTGTSGNSGLTTYVYELNTVKVTDPANRWKKYEMDGFGNLVKVTEPKPVSGEYETTYVYSALNELKTVTMTRDGFTAGSPATITQTRQFTYSGGRLQSTQLPEVPGTTTYAYNADGRCCRRRIIRACGSITTRRRSSWRGWSGIRARSVSPRI